MGLDIWATSKVTPVAGTHDTDECDHAHAYIADPSFVRSIRGLVEDACYDTMPDAEGMSFRAGSYSGYTEFRKQLAEGAGLDLSAIWADPLGHQDEPFFELLNFSDCEGTIGPEAAKDLYEDFLKYRTAFISKQRGDEYAIERYDNWTEACRLASDGGLISFG